MVVSPLVSQVFATTPQLDAVLHLPIDFLSSSSTHSLFLKKGQVVLIDGVRSPCLRKVSWTISNGPLKMRQIIDRLLIFGGWYALDNGKDQNVKCPLILWIAKKVFIWSTENLPFKNPWSMSRLRNLSLENCTILMRFSSTNFWSVTVKLTGTICSFTSNFWYHVVCRTK